MYVISSFGIVLLIKYFGNMGLFFLLIPVITGYGFGLFHFINLKKKEDSEEEARINEEYAECKQSI